MLSQSQLIKSNSERVVKSKLRAFGPAVLLSYLIAAAIPGANGATSCSYTLDGKMTVDVSEALCPAGITLSPSNNSECQVWMWQTSDSDPKPVLFAEVSSPLNLLFNISNVPEEAKQGLVITCRSLNSHRILGPVTFVITEEGVSPTPTSSPPSLSPPQTSPTASSSTSPTPAATLPTPTKSTPSWLIIVIVITLAAIAAVIIGIVCCCYKRREQQKRDQSHQTENHSTEDSVPVPLQPTTPIYLPPRSMCPQLQPTSTEPVLASTPTENVQEDVSPQNSFSFSEEVSNTGNVNSETVSDFPTPPLRTHPRSRGNTRGILSEAEQESHSINTSPQTFLSHAGDSAINIEDLDVCVRPVNLTTISH